MPCTRSSGIPTANPAGSDASSLASDAAGLTLAWRRHETAELASGNVLATGVFECGHAGRLLVSGAQLGSGYRNWALDLWPERAGGVRHERCFISDVLERRAGD